MAIASDINEMLLDDILNIYTQAENEMLRRLAKRVKKGIKTTGWTESKLKDVQMLKKEIESTLGNANKITKSKLSKGILQAFNLGVDSVSKSLKITGKSILSGMVPEHLQRLVLESNNLIDNTSFQILRNTQDMYRQVISETSTGVLTGVVTREQAAQDALNRFAAKGITGFVDKAGRHWELGSYVEMATRTTTAHAALQGHVDRQAEIGNDLMMISSLGTTCPICSKWQGKVLSISGNDPKYPSLASAKAAGVFHPNCKHTLTAYFPEIDDYEPPVTKNNPEKYEATQEQRYNERQIRKWKRVEAAAMTPEAKAKAANMVKKWQGIQRDHVTAWDLRRQYGRESIKNRVGDASKVRTKSEPKPTPKVVDKPKPKAEFTPDQVTAIKRYTTGNHKMINEQADSVLNGVAREKAFGRSGEILFDAVNSSQEVFENLYRIESISGFSVANGRVINSPLKEGEELIWGLRSTSKSEKFISKAAQGKDKNLPFVGGEAVEDRTVYRIKNGRGLDVTEISPYNQSEVIVSGVYEVVNSGTIEKIGGQEVIVIDLRRKR